MNLSFSLTMKIKITALFLGVIAACALPMDAMHDPFAVTLLVLMVLIGLLAMSPTGVRPAGTTSAR